MTDPVKPKRKVTAQISYSLSPSTSPSLSSAHVLPSSTPSSSASGSLPKVRARVDPSSIASSSQPRSASPIHATFDRDEPARPRLRSSPSSSSLRSAFSGSSARVKSPTVDSGSLVPPVPPLPRDARSDTPTSSRPRVPRTGSQAGPMSPPLTSPGLSSKASIPSLPKVKAPLSVKSRASDNVNVNSNGSGSNSSRSASPVPPITKGRPSFARSEHTPEATPNRPPSRSAIRPAIGGVGMTRVKSSPIADISKAPAALPLTPTHPPLRARARTRGLSNAGELPPPSPSALEVASMPLLSPGNLLQVSPTNNPGGWTSRVPSPHDRASTSPRHLSPSPTRAFFDPPSASPSRAESPQPPDVSLANRTIPSSPVPSAVSNSFAYLQGPRTAHPNVSAPTTPLSSHAAFLPDYGASQGRLAKRPLPIHPHIDVHPGPPTPTSPVLRTVELPVSTPRGSSEWHRGAVGGLEGSTPVTPAAAVSTGVGAGRYEATKKDSVSRLSGSTAVDSSPHSPSVVDDENRQKSLILNFQGTPPEIAVIRMEDENASPDQAIDVVLEAEKDAVKEARINRKISNASLLAINRSLEATKSKQRAEILKLRRALRESLAGGAPQLSKGRVGTSALLGPSPLADGTTADEDEDDDEDEFDPEAEAEMEARWDKISQAMGSILKRGQEAIAQTGVDVGSSGRVLGWDEVQSAAPSEREGSATPDVW